MAAVASARMDTTNGPASPLSLRSTLVARRGIGFVPPATGVLFHWRQRG